MAWASAVSATQLTSITTVQYFLYGGNALVTLNPGELAHITIDVNPPGTPTDTLTVRVLDTADDGTNYSDVPYLTFDIPNTPDPCQAGFVVSGIRAFKVGVVRNGSTDTFTSADSVLRKNGVDL